MIQVRQWIFTGYQTNTTPYPSSADASDRYVHGVSLIASPNYRPTFTKYLKKLMSNPTKILDVFDSISQIRVTFHNFSYILGSTILLISQLPIGRWRLYKVEE